MDELNQVHEHWKELLLKKEEPCLEAYSSEKARRLQFYRNAFFSNIEKTLTNCYPYSSELVGETWAELIYLFLSQKPPRGHILKFCPEEFYQFFKETPHPIKEQFPFLENLMDYELTELLLLFKEETEMDYVFQKFDAQKCLDAPPIFNPDLVIKHYSFPVHFISKEENFSKKLPQGGYFLALYRDLKTLSVEFMEVSEGIFDWWEENKKSPVTFGESLKKWLSEMPKDLQEEFRTQFFHFLKDAFKKGFLLGKLRRGSKE